MGLETWDHPFGSGLGPGGAGGGPGEQSQLSFKTTANSTREELETEVGRRLTGPHGPFILLQTGLSLP